MARDARWVVLEGAGEDPYLVVKLRQLRVVDKEDLADNTILLMPNILLVGFAESGRDYNTMM
jgi:hypothetical protein